MIAEALNSVAKGYVSYVGNPKLMNNVMADIVIQIPTQAEEREQLSSFFAKLDNLITLHQRKCALLFSPFQAFISMMFTTSTFSWEQRKLGDVVKEITRNDPESEAPIMMITANNGFIEQSERYAFNNAGESLKKYILLKKGELAYNHGASKLRPYGSCFALTTAENARIPFVYHCFSAENQNAEFMSIELNGAEIENQLRKIVSSGARMDGLLNISFDEYTSVSVLLPGTEEQDRIADFFRHLDNLITLHQRKCIFFTGRAGRLISTVNKKRITSSWEQRKFGEVFDCTVPNNTLSRAELSYDEGTVLNVHYGDVLIKYGSVLDVQKDDIPRIPHRCREDFNGALLQDGDIIIADTAEDETTGKACEISNLQGSVIVSGLHTMVCRPRNRMALGYLGYYLNSNAYHHQLLPLMQGIKVLSLSRSNIQKTSVSYPTAVKEQQHIAYYFSQLDNLITLHQRKPFLMKWRTSDANRNQTNRLVL